MKVSNSLRTMLAQLQKQQKEMEEQKEKEKTVSSSEEGGKGMQDINPEMIT